MRRTLDRRSMLRGLLGGATVAVGLPALEIMLDDNGGALAGGRDLPNRFGLWFWGNGTRPESWYPTTQGTNWEPGLETEPLRDLRPYVSVVGGTHLRTATHAHHAGMAGIHTGAKYLELGTTRDSIVSTFAYPSVDVLAADVIGYETPFRSLEVGVTKFRGSDEGSTFQHLSHDGPNLPNPSEYDPGALFRRLFTEGDVRQDFARTTVLDAVTAQARDLSRRLGAADRLRLEQHLASIRTLEQRLAAAGYTCDPGDEPAAPPDLNGQEPIVEKNQLMSELLALALACDLTRVFSLQFSTCGSGVVVWQVGATESLHYLCHTEALPQPTVHAATTFTMERFADFLRTLRDTPEGDGNLLDRCAILASTEVVDGRGHGIADWPFLIAGKAGGRLRGNVHHRAEYENASRVPLTVLRAVAPDVESFGHDEGYVTESFSEV